MKNERITRILAALAENGISQMLITDPMSIYYLCGVTVDPGERFYALYICADGRRVMFINRLFTVPEIQGLALEWYSDTDDVAALVYPHIDHSSVLGVDKDLKARFLLAFMENGTAAGYKNASPAVDAVRGVKDADEQKKMRAASRINDAAMARFKTLIHEGVTEKEVASQMLGIYRELGAEDFSFNPIVSFGANAADPHHEPDDTVLKEGDCVLFDVGCMKDGYCSDMTRTFYYKRMDKRCREIYELVRRANEAAEAKLRPGVPLCEIDAAARGLITEAGYGREFNHRLGHFIGLSVHEFGDVSSVNTAKTVPGMVFSIEPGIYLAGNTGVRIEDLALVTEEGVEILNSYPKTAEIIE